MTAATGIALFEVGRSFQLSMTISQAVMDTFRDLSGDHSRIHSDAPYASTHGFKQPLAYGNLLGALVSKLVGMELPTRDVILVRQSIDFRSPAFVGETVDLRATVASVHESVASAKLTLEFSTDASGVIATGQCTVKCL